MTNIITACFGGTRYTNTRPAWLIDHGMVLQINGVELPESYFVDFANSKAEQATRVLGNADGVVIPDQYFLNNAKQIYAWVYLTTGDSGFTTLQITIPLAQRPDVSTEPPTPQETDLIEKAIAALTDGVERAEDAAELLENCSAEAETLPEGSQATASYSDGVFSFGIPTGATGATGAKGDKGDKGDTGEQGPKGDTGTTFTPAVSEQGVISWSNDGGLPNPQPRNIKGPAGKDGEVGATPNLTIGTVETLEPGEDATAEITGTAENPVLNLGIPQGEQGEGADTSNYAPIIINSASGDIASFADGADGLPVKALTVNVEPIQDLHGYDSPWPAGGGANLLDLDKASYNSLAYGLTVSRDGDGVRITGTVTQSGNLSFNLITDYSGETLGGKGYVLQVFDVTSGYTVGGVWGFRTESERAFAISLTGMTEGQVVNCFMKLSVAETSQTAWSPYSNICPISGRTSATVTRTGKNLLKLSDWETESNSGITIGTDNISIINKGYQENLNRYNVLNRSACVFSFHVKTIAMNDSRASFAVYADGTTKLTGIGTVSSGNITLDSVGTEKDITITVPNGKEYISFGGWAWGGEVQISNLQLELSSTASAYEPYAGNTYTIPLGQTVYGGTDDVINGNGSDEWTKLKLLSSFSWQMDGTTGNGKRFGLPYASNPSIVKAINQNNTYISNVLAPHNIGLNAHDFGTFYISSSWIVVHDNNSHFETLADFKAWLDSEDVYLVYKVATPTTFTHTPTQISTLLGTNNIWSDAGTVDVDYRADTKLYIDNIHTPTDDDMTADAQIASGKYFLIGGNLYKSTTVIPAGDTIRPGTNCVKTNLAEALNALNT